ncbi:MAG TPA: hypothetical protein VEZ41_11880, partial [Allosphingosinicella sp.]|nr:hypothetical protein [Allosphingosinicella sp.]
MNAHLRTAVIEYLGAGAKRVLVRNPPAKNKPQLSKRVRKLEAQAAICGFPPGKMKMRCCDVGHLDTDGGPAREPRP